MNAVKIISLSIALALTLGCQGGTGSNGTATDANGTLDDANGTLSDANGARIDASPNSPPDASVITPDGGFNGVECGDTICSSAEECCVEGFGSGSCVNTGTCKGSTVSCDGPEDCSSAGDVCCGDGPGAVCDNSNSCSSEVCNSPDDCPIKGESCCSFGPGANTCRSFCFGN